MILSGQDGEKKNLRIPHTGVSPPASSRKHTGRSRSDILADCQKLVNEILREHSEGYSFCSFRKSFLLRFGYPIDLQKLGYQKLASLLKIMPGVKIESNCIIPSNDASSTSDLETGILGTQGTNSSHAVANSDNELSDSAKKDDGSFSPREELGPVSMASSKGSEMESKSREKSTELLNILKHPDYEHYTSDEQLSESSGEISSLTGPKGRRNTKSNGGDGSLMQILDSWHSSKECDVTRNKSENADLTVGHLSDGLKLFDHCAAPGTDSESSMGNYRRKQKPYRSYTFVSDPVISTTS
ncbi:Endonuclease or glycosyl hydrolase, putative isoform 1 [Quillaja saponaria]|uniref:Endonuclease or glycosyl hydrolase, putative isoform 1 n=1 Tax=Quillaja saponaria TaxID=32244 RepID=A0AAD7KSN5_QUISA|nr:Endonuclease or glycosyl hydrolase, putative isoform 1 [Quillaja saponaria]